VGRGRCFQSYCSRAGGCSGPNTKESRGFKTHSFAAGRECDRADEQTSAHPGYVRDRPDDVRTSGTCHGWSIPETGLNDRNHS
jgi:hypothetical protein